ncbi:MAG: hypothetical protein KAH22_06005, partial [Thiotrichaceae bacterium]|nr:hypothetical protein [Thiotrichaceae bacterium]
MISSFFNTFNRRPIQHGQISSGYQRQHSRHSHQSHSKPQFSNLLQLINSLLKQLKHSSHGKVDGRVGPIGLPYLPQPRPNIHPPVNVTRPYPRPNIHPPVDGPFPR